MFQFSGFLVLDDPAYQVPGNAGLKDQRLALRWIEQNIHFFNGNPANVTLIGESAGACSAHYHLLSNNSANLFHKAIIMSGCALNPWSTVDRKLGIAQRFALRLGWKPNSNENILAFLQNVPAEDIVREQDHLLSDDEKAKHIHYPFGPVVETFEDDDSVISASPLSMVQNEQCWSHLSQVPVLILATSDEGLYLRHELIDRRIEDVVGYLKNLVPFDLDSRMHEDVVNKLNALYFQSNVISLENVQPFVDFITDKWFLHGLHRTVKGRIDNKRGLTFVLRFNVDLGPMNHFKTLLSGEDIEG